MILYLLVINLSIRLNISRKIISIALVVCFTICCIGVTGCSSNTSTESSTNNDAQETTNLADGSESKIGTPVAFLIWNCSDQSSFVSIHETPEYTEAVGAKWITNDTFGFCSDKGTHINGKFTDDWDSELEQFKPEFWTDDGTKVIHPSNGGVWAIERSGDLIFI